MLQVCHLHCLLKDKELIDEDEYKQMKAVILGKMTVG